MYCGSVERKRRSDRDQIDVQVVTVFNASSNPKDIVTMLSKTVTETANISLHIIFGNSSAELSHVTIRLTTECPYGYARSNQSYHCGKLCSYKTLAFISNRGHSII